MESQLVEASDSVVSDASEQTGEEGFLAQEAWSSLKDAASTESFAAAWLEIQCRLIGDVDHAVVVLGRADEGPFSAMAAGRRLSPGAGGHRRVLAR